MLLCLLGVRVCVCVFGFGFFGRLLVQAKVDTYTPTLYVFDLKGLAECIAILAQVSKIHVCMFLSKLKV